MKDERQLWLWRQRKLVQGTPAERYLRQVRGYYGPIPATLGYLAPREGYPPSLIAAFGLTSESEPALLAIADADIRGVHVTRLAQDGDGKAGSYKTKIMIGHSRGSPIILAPPNDLLGLAISEGIEDALSIHAATGLGAWAAGSAGRMPALAEVVPPYIDHITIIAHADKSGVAGAEGLLAGLRKRGIAALISYLRAPA